MTQKVKVKIERNNKLKKFFLKTLHIISYILSIGFIAVLIISGCQSCQRTSSVSAENLNLQNSLDNDIQYYYDNYSVYNFKLKNGNYGFLSNQLVDDFGLPSGPVGDSVGTVRSFSFNLSNTYVFDGLNGDFYSVSTFYYDFKVQTDGETPVLKFWRFDRLTFYSDYAPNWLHPFSKNNSNSDDDGYSVSSIQLYFSNDDVSLITDFDLFYEEVDNTSSFIFNKNFNYNAPMLVSTRSPYGTGVTGGTSQGTLYNKLVLNTGWFISNEQVFDRIEFWYQLSDGLSFDFDGTTKQGPQGMWSYWCTYYVNSFSNTMIIVNSRDVVAYMPSSNTYGYYQANSSTWSVDSYRFITFLEPISNSLKDKIEQFNNNNQNSFSGNIYVDGGDVFTLLGTAFNSLSDFFGLAILPGISIGVLFFLPLIVGIIVVMFHILKK